MEKLKLEVTAVVVDVDDPVCMGKCRFTVHSNGRIEAECGGVSLNLKEVDEDVLLMAAVAGRRAIGSLGRW